MTLSPFDGPEPRAFNVRPDFFEWKIQDAPTADRIVAILFEAHGGLMPTEIASQLQIDCDIVYDVGLTLGKWGYIEAIKLDHLANLVAGDKRDIRWKLSLLSWLFCENVVLRQRIDKLQSTFIAEPAAPSPSLPDPVNIALAAIIRQFGKPTPISNQWAIRVHGVIEDMVGPGDRIMRTIDGLDPSNPGSTYIYTREAVPVEKV